ncbi:MAG: cupredoxin domain-containing protein [Nanoarchaeota archaeon]|nr:cupredoxin domain-containing protein [Nanoarchaeota archaeon]
MKYIIGIVVIAILVLGGVYIYQSMSSDNSSTAVNNQGSSGRVIQGDVTTKVINIVAARWQYTPSTITVNKGDYVIININNTDKDHGISIPDLGLSGIESLEFTADKVGTFQFQCPTFCGTGHRNMTGTLIVQ